VPVDDGLRDLDDLSVGVSCVRAKHVERLLLADRVALAEPVNA
jgi:hypothetical protein